MKKILILILLVVSSTCLLIGSKTYCAVTEDYYNTGNIFSYNSPYTITPTYAQGPNSDMFKLTITGNLSSLQYITFTNLNQIAMLDLIGYTSGSGFYSNISNNSVNQSMYLDYLQWQSMMAFDVSSMTFTNTLIIYFHYTLTGGATNTTFYTDFKNNVSIYFNTSFDLETLLNEAYESGKNDYVDSIGNALEDAYNQGVTDTFTYGVEYVSNYDMENSHDWQVGQAAGAGANEVELMNLAYVMQGFFRTFNILGIEVLPNITIGMIVGVQLLLGLMAFIVGVATFTIDKQSRSNRHRK